MTNSYYLATTADCSIWETNKSLLIINPWCIASKNNKEFIKGRNYKMVSSPWLQHHKRKDAVDYCRGVYLRLLPELTVILNKVHNVGFSIRSNR